MKQGAESAGHPVDVATGAVYNFLTDCELPGVFPLVWERRYNTGFLGGTITPLGPGWTAPCYAHLTRTGTDYHFRTPQGDVEIFPDPDDLVVRGKVIRSLGTFQELGKHGMLFKITRWNSETGEVSRFAFMPGRNGHVWPLLSMEDVAGQGLDLSWDERGLLRGIRQRLERRTLVFAHTDAGRLFEVAFMHADGGKAVQARYEYDGKGRLAAATDAAQHSDRYEYDEAGRLVREILKDGGVFSFQYDETGRCVRTSGLEGFDRKILRYRDSTGWTDVVDGHGHTSRFKWLPSGQVTQEINPLGGISETAYDEYGRIAVKIDPLGGKTEYAYDEAGNRSRIIGPLGNTVITEFNADHQPTAIIDAMGAKWRRSYDDKGRFVTGIDPLGKEWSFAYGPAGELISVSDPVGNARRFPRKSNGELAAEVDWLGNATALVWDAFGRVVESTNPTGAKTRYTYDTLGHPRQITHPDGTTTRFQYDAGRNLIAFTNRLGHTARMQYGSCRRLLATIDPLGRTTRYVWDIEPDRVLEITNALGEKHRFLHDGMGNVVRETTFDGRVLEYKYDAAGRSVACIDAMGGRTGLFRDALGRIVRKELPDGTVKEFSYDLNGNRLRASGPGGVLEFAWDMMGRIIKEDQAGIQLEFRYDAVGNPIGITTSSGHTQAIEFDANGLAVALLAEGKHQFRFGWDAAGNEISRTLPTGYKLTQDFDLEGRLAGQNLRLPPSGLTAAGDWPQPGIQRRFRYDALGNLLGIRDAHWGTHAMPMT